MRKEDLKVGMLLEVEEHGHKDLCILTINEGGELGYSGKTIWGNVSKFREDLTYGCLGENKVLKVYGRTCNQQAHRLSTIDRPLLWERGLGKPKPKELTIAEIEKELGYPIKVVK